MTQTLELLQSPFVIEPVVSVSKRRKARREEVRKELEEAKELAGQTVELQKEANRATKEKRHEDSEEWVRQVELSTRRGKERLEMALSALEGDHYEIECPKSGVFFHHADEAEARLAWNKFVKRWNNGLKDCCKTEENQHNRTDYDGMTVVRCTKCGSKHLPFGDYT